MANNSGELGFPPPHPGEYLREDILPHLDTTIADLAAHLGVTRATLSSLINEKRSVSTAMAIRLGKAFQNGARFWLALQIQYDIWEKNQHNIIDIKPIHWNDRAA